MSKTRYTEEHEWLRAENDVVTVGVSTYAAEQLGDVVFIELPEVGAKIAKGDEIVVIESVKVASGIEATGDGEIVEVNEAIVETPEIVNKDPMGEGWFFRVKFADMSVLDSLMDEDAYKAFIS